MGQALEAASETSVESDDPAFLIRHKHTDELRSKLVRGLVPNKIWGMAEMVTTCSAELKENGLFNEASVLDMTAGDLEVREDTMRLIAQRLGLAPGSEKQLAIEKRKQELRFEHFSMDHESLLRYQPSGVGFEPLRKHFASWLSGYTLPISADQTLIAPGSFSGIDNVWGAFFASELNRGQHMDVIFPVPGFKVVAVQAQRRGIPVRFIQTSPETGYCVTDEALCDALGEVSDRRTLLYLTPMGNPASDVFDQKVMEGTLTMFNRLRPRGGTILDLAYLEHIPGDQAIELLSRLTPDMLQRAIFSSSMSKMFFYTGLRIAALHTINGEFHDILKAQWQTAFATQSGSAQLEATAHWELVSNTDREQGYALLRDRQQATMSMLSRIDYDRIQKGKPPIFDVTHVHSSIPLYLYLKLQPGFDYLSCFEHTGVAGLSGEVFGDLPEHNMLRLSMGVESIEDAVVD